MANITLRSVKASPLTNSEIDNNFTNLNTDAITSALAGTAFTNNTAVAVGKILYVLTGDTPPQVRYYLVTGAGTTHATTVPSHTSGTTTNGTATLQYTTRQPYDAVDVLEKIKLVDGSGSGLDADLLDGMTTATANTASTIVYRDASGNFSAGTITATLSGNATNVSGTVAIANGGTGATTLTANNVILGNGTSAVQFVAPGTAGNVLTSNGTTWTSSTPTTVSAATSTALGTVYGLTDPNSGLYRTALGYGAVQNGTGASYSVGIGVLALNAVTTGGFNVGVGWGSFRTITTASNNTGLGHGTGGATTSGADNTAVGYTALASNTTGFNNTAVGSNASSSATTGTNNTAVGFQALRANTVGSENVALGSSALGNTAAASTGSGNVAIGFNTMFATTSGAQNTGVGGSALRYNTTGEYNAAFGYVASFNNTTGYNNAALGSFALYVATTAYQNTAVGYQAGDKITTGNNNTVIGMGAASSGTNDLTTGSNNIIIGYNAEASSATVSNEVTIGNTSITSTRLRGMVQVNAAMLEQATVSATAATGTINFDARTQSVLYYTTNSSANWTLNIRAAAGVSLDSVMATGQSMTIAFLATNGATAYYQSALTIDGASVTPKWQGGTAPTAGNASSIDAYVVTIIKTGAATFTALASQTKFA